ncbi:MAG: MBL fold metallo-hydrolase [Lachnospiraceae bacterium]|nr:MBL fold metallo-hydrolase [Lachnospiraceae bacterium]
MIIERVVSDLLDSNMYLICENQRTIIVDPCIIDKKIFNVDYILLTHEHYDHISGVNYWKSKTGAKVIASEICAEKCIDSRKNLSRYFDSFCDIQTWLEGYVAPQVSDYECEVDLTFNKNCKIEWEGHSICIKECPGHSLGSCLIFLDDKFVFSGDSIFENMKTESGFPGGSRKAWREVGYPLVESLRDDYIVYPGHFKEFIFKDRYKNNK